MEIEFLQEVLDAYLDSGARACFSAALDAVDRSSGIQSSALASELSSVRDILENCKKSSSKLLYCFTGNAAS